MQKLVMEAKIEQCFEVRMDVFVAVGDIAFPGYGWGNDAVTRLGDGSTLMLLDVEIPRADAHRFFLFHERGGIYELVDDFVDRDGNPIRAVGESKEGIVYTRIGGDVMVRKPERR